MPKILENPKNSILLYAKEIVITEGIENLTMREVSKKSGIAVGTIYNYFPTKKDLTIELIENYWYDYLNLVDNIDKSSSDFFLKLRDIFADMAFFVDKFKEVWIKNNSSEYTIDVMNRKNLFTDKLIKKLEYIIQKEKDEKSISFSMDSYTLAKFLILNFMMMSQTKQFHYDDFEKIIKDYLCS